jgi:hypothetical protein
VVPCSWQRGGPITLASDTQVLRGALDSLAVKLDGTAAAPATIARKRSALYSALEYAVELDLFESNPIDKMQWTAPEHTDVVDRRVVANPKQARALLAAVRDIYPALEAFFGCLYFSGLRPSEAARLDEDACLLPVTDDAWGELLLAGSTQHAGSAWTDSGEARDFRYWAGWSPVRKSYWPLRSSIACLVQQSGVVEHVRPGLAEGS